MPGGVGSAAEAELAKEYKKDDKNEVIAYDPDKGSAGQKQFELWLQTITTLKMPVAQSLPEVARWLGSAPKLPSP